MAAFRPLASGVLVLVLAACGGLDREQPPTETPASLAGTVADVPPSASAKTLVKQVARSVWGVVPDPPRRKKELRPELIRGSAVAVAPDTLLASCRLVSQRREVGVVRHRKYCIARVVRPQSDQDVCALRVANAPLKRRQWLPQLCGSARGRARLCGRQSHERRVSLRGRASGREGRPGRSVPGDYAAAAAAYLERGAVRRRCQSGGPTEDSLVLGAPLSAVLVPRLAQRDLGPSVAPVIAMAVQKPKRRLWIMRDEQDGDDDGGSALQIVAVAPVAAPAVPRDGDQTGGRPDVGADIADSQPVGPDLATDAPDSDGQGEGARAAPFPAMTPSRPVATQVAAGPAGDSPARNGGQGGSASTGRGSGAGSGEDGSGVDSTGGGGSGPDAPGDADEGGGGPGGGADNSSAGSGSLRGPGGHGSGGDNPDGNGSSSRSGTGSAGGDPGGGAGSHGNGHGGASDPGDGGSGNSSVGSNPGGGNRDHNDPGGAARVTVVRAGDRTTTATTVARAAALTAAIPPSMPPDWTRPTSRSFSCNQC